MNEKINIKGWLHKEIMDGKYPDYSDPLINHDTMEIIEVTDELKSFMDETPERHNKLVDRLFKSDDIKIAAGKRSLKK